MLNRNFEQIFTTKALLEALKQYKNSPGFIEAKEQINSKNFIKKLKKGYIPTPLKGFEIDKNNGEKRQLAQASALSKAIQKVLANELLEAIKLNNKSYAFRKNKGVLKAINRTKDFLKHYNYVAKADIDDFFDSINQKKLIKTLKKVIKDKQVVMLISLFLKNGMLKNQEWIDKSQGVYQGDVLSPVLSNIYLHSFDEALEKRGIDFVRFADDMVFFANSKKEAIKVLQIATNYLNALDLTFGNDKSYIASLDEGFEFLGLRFKGNTVSMDNKRFLKKISTISQKCKKKQLQDCIEFLNEYLKGIKNYYNKALSNKQQLILINEHIEEILIKKIATTKKRKTINKKSKFIQILTELYSIFNESFEDRQKYAHFLTDKAYELLASQEPLKSAQKKIDKKKRSFLQNQIKSSEIILDKFGLYISVNRGKIVVKEYGKVIQKSPINSISRVIVLSKGISFSSNLIQECAKRKIDIDFINKSKPYAQIVYFNTVSNELHLKQLSLINTQKGFKIAQAVIKAKMKNQINLIKYYSRYRENNDIKTYKILEKNINKMESILNKVKESKKSSSLMGLEGSLSLIYWQCFAILIEEPNFKRETLNATHPINQALNYGYAFIYHRMQSALLKSGVNIYYSFLHSLQDNKPTLVYDMVELFRQAVVDREIISILNLGAKLNSSKGKLTKESVKIVTQNIQERLATPTKWRKGKYKLSSIIDDQALELAHVIKGTKLKFKGFVARF